MQTSKTDVIPSVPGLGSLTARRVKLAIMLGVMVGVWNYARFQDHPLIARVAGVLDYSRLANALIAVRAGQPVAPTLGSGAFPNPEIFVVTPDPGKRRIHVRSGPGFAYRSVDTLDRGTEVTGIARTREADGSPWIQLSGDRRFVKESVLAFERVQPR